MEAKVNNTVFIAHTIIFSAKIMEYFHASIYRNDGIIKGEIRNRFKLSSEERKKIF